MNGEPALAVKPDLLRVALVDADEVVESSGISTTFHVWSVASGAKETLRFAAMPSQKLSLQTKN